MPNSFLGLRLHFIVKWNTWYYVLIVQHALWYALDCLFCLSTYLTQNMARNHGNYDLPLKNDHGVGTLWPGPILVDWHNKSHNHRNITAKIPFFNAELRLPHVRMRTHTPLFIMQMCRFTHEHCYRLLNELIIITIKYTKLCVSLHKSWQLFFGLKIWKCGK
jgi:hypothetical protein